MSTFRADMHCHSTCSDGTLTPEKILCLAKEAHLSGISITDHDTMAAYKTATKIAKEMEIFLIPGVELSAVHKGHSIHILGYAFSEESKVMATFCERHYQRRLNRNAMILDLLGKHSMFIEKKDVDEFSSVIPGRPHIAQAMMKKGYVRSIQEAFDKYLGEGKYCYQPGEKFTVEETLEIIHRAGGLAVIAHPHQIKNQRIIKDLLSMEFDGIEGYYGRLSSELEQKWINLGKQKGLLILGGSDFHGSVKPDIHLGSSWIDEETFQKIYIHYLGQNNQCTAIF
ncbi:MAG: PHP domain-containing protein [Chlamydiales bacterium]